MAYIGSEIPVGVIDGVNTTFTSASPFVSTSISVSLNGLLLLKTTDYTVVSSTTVSLTQAPLVGDVILFSYTKI